MGSAQDAINPLYIVGPLLIALLAVILTLVLRQRRKSTIVATREQVIAAQAAWSAPDGLANASLPRAVAFTGTSIAVGVVVVLVVAGAGVLSWYLAQKTARDKQETELLQREGVVARATITRKWMSGGKSHTRYVAYHYSAPDGLHSATATVTSGFYRRIGPDSTAQVIYAASNPAINHIEYGVLPPPWVPYAVLIPMVAILFIPVVVFQQKKLLEYGTPAAAVIERVSPIKGGVNLHYQFIGPSGDTVKGKCSFSGAGRPVAGETITVIYDPERPKRSSRYPLKYVKLADVI